MGWRFVTQPNGLLARFSEVVDDFTHYDLSWEEAISICTDDHKMYFEHAEIKVNRAAENPARFTEAIVSILHVHGLRCARQRWRDLGPKRNPKRLLLF